MAKKLRAKDLRLKREEERRKKFEGRNPNPVPVEKEVPVWHDDENNQNNKGLSAEQNLEENKSENKEKEKSGKRIKSFAKASGVKAVYRACEGRTIITTFGRGNDSTLDKKIVGDDITQLNESSKLAVDSQSDKKNFIVAPLKSKMSGKTAKPEKNAGNDILGLRDVMEREIFGENFDDNIRVQICYAVFDIIKVLVPVASQVVYAVNSLDRVNGSENDLIGANLNYEVPLSYYGLGAQSRKKEIFEEFLENARDNFIYFSDIFYNSEIIETEKGRKKTVYKIKPQEEIYTILLCLNFFRNNISHFGSNKLNLFKKVYDDLTFNEEKYPLLQKTDKDIKHMLDETFRSAIKTVNNNAMRNEDNNLYLFANALNASESMYPSLACRLYRQSILKSDRNLGFSLRKIREIAVEKEYITLPFTIQKLNSFRSKLYKIIDAVLLYCLEKDELVKAQQDMLDELRLAMTEEEKAQIYEKYAELIFKDEEVRCYTRNVIDLFVQGFYAKKDAKIRIDKEWINDVKIKDDVHDFTKLIYFVSRFLDGKEINKLLTALINRFQVIAAFNKNIEELTELFEIKEGGYTDKYSIFEDSAQIAEELNAVKSISKMNRGLEGYNLNSLYKEALISLGVKNEDVDRIYDEKISSDAEHSLSAFIGNNVVKSGRFMYVIKYLNSTAIYDIAHNRAIVSFILNRLPENQIERYYQSVVKKIDEKLDVEKKREKVLNVILETNFDNVTSASVYNLKRKEKLSPQDAIDKERRKAVLSLYYTVVYIFVKNMVNINARYIMAFSYLERDKYFFKEKLGESVPECIFSNYAYYDSLTRIFAGISEGDVLHLNNRERKNIVKYLAVPTDQSIAEQEESGFVKKEDIDAQRAHFSTRHDYIYKIYRNAIEHISVVSGISTRVNGIEHMESYFSAFQLLLQQYIVDTALSGKKTKRPLKGKNKGSNMDKKRVEIREYRDICNILNLDFKADDVHLNEYSKSFLRRINIPFAYNLSRYKNLTSEKIFESIN